MQFLIPPGQGIDAAYLSLSRAEAKSLRDALDLMLSVGSAGWHAYVSWGAYNTDITVNLNMDDSPNPMGREASNN